MSQETTVFYDGLLEHAEQGVKIRFYKESGYSKIGKLHTKKCVTRQEKIAKSAKTFGGTEYLYYLCKRKKETYL